MIQPILGIDISKDTFDIVLLAEMKRAHATFENTPVGFNRLNQWLNKNDSIVELHACMEATGQYGELLAEFLFQQSYKISVVNPARIKAYAGSRLRRNKTDKADAELIAEYCLREKPPSWSPPPASFKDLQAFVRRLEDLQNNRQQEYNRIHSGVRTTMVVDDIQAHLQFLDEQIKRIKKAMQAHIDTNAELKRRQELLVSIPGIGKLTAAKILGEVRDIREFESARQLSAYAGVTPRQFISGSSIHKKSRISKIGNANLRKILFMPAIIAKRYNPIIRSFCDRLLLNGKLPMEVVCAAMHKLLCIVYGILKSGKPFDPYFLDKSTITP